MNVLDTPFDLECAGKCPFDVTNECDGLRGKNCASEECCSRSRFGKDEAVAFSFLLDFTFCKGLPRQYGGSEAPRTMRIDVRRNNNERRVDGLRRSCSSRREMSERTWAPSRMINFEKLAICLTSWTGMKWRIEGLHQSGHHMKLNWHVIVLQKASSHLSPVVNTIAIDIGDARLGAEDTWTPCLMLGPLQSQSGSSTKDDVLVKPTPERS